MTSLTSVVAQPAGRVKGRGLLGWLDAMPHPGPVVEMADSHIAAARWGRGLGTLGAFAAEPLPPGAIVPSATQTNILQRHAVQEALRGVLSRVSVRGQQAALLLPDPVIRVFILPFDSLPRRVEEALPLVRWRLKKILPFDAEEAVISWMKQSSREGRAEIVAAVARQKVIREYEVLLEEETVLSGVVQSSTLATLPLLNDHGATLLVRLSGGNLTTVIVREEVLCVYRSTALSAEPHATTPQAIFEEVFPAVAFYQDSWGGKIEQLRLAGFGAGEEEVRETLAREIDCPVASQASSGEGTAEARSLLAQGLESLVGWQWNQGA